MVGYLQGSHEEVSATTGSRSLGGRKRRLGSHGDRGSWVVYDLWGRACKAGCSSIQRQKGLLGKVFSCMLEYRTTTRGPLFIQSLLDVG